MRKAVHLEYWNIGLTVSYVTVVGLAMGSSQAMRSAWVDDLLSFIPPIAFLIGVHFEARPANKNFPYGYDRVNGLGFLVAAVALTAVGAFLLKDAITSLISNEHATVGSIRLWGHDLWLGWLMIAAQAYAAIPPLIIGHIELRYAEKLNDKLLHTDALMNKANWQTGIAGIVGVAGLGMGWWWADAVAAAFISFSIIADGIKSMRIATRELLDGAPCELGERHPPEQAKALEKAIKKDHPTAKVLLRQTGRYIRAEVTGAAAATKLEDQSIEEARKDWRVDSIAFRRDGK